MLSKNFYGSFDERPYHETEPSSLCLVFLVEIIKSLLHGLSKLLPKSTWIVVKEFLVKIMDCVLVIRHSWLSANISGGRRKRKAQT